MAETGKEFNCDLCGTKEAVELPHAREYSANEPIHICVKCGFVYVKKRRSAERIAQAWSNEIFGKGYTALTPHVQGRLTYVAEFIHQTVGLSGKKVVDIGAGEGLFLNMIKKAPYQASVFGIEPSEKNCAQMEKMGIDHHLGTLESYFASKNSKKEKSDIVTLTWTLENCQKPRGIVEGAYDLLADGGYLVIATGSRILVPFKKPLNTYISKNPADTHPTRYSLNTLRGMMAECHFKMAHVNPALDNDILCMIGKKMPKNAAIPWKGDNYLDVFNFFERWHVETKIYYS